MVKKVLQSPRNPQFFQPLLPGFDSHLNIPVTFYSKHVQGSNEYKTAKLRSDASDTTWEVTIDNGRILTGGWREFVVAHDLRIGDVLVLRHEGDLVFHVTVLGPSFCEVQYVQENIRNLSMDENLKIEPESLSSFLQNENRFVKLSVTPASLKQNRLYLPTSFTRAYKMNYAAGKTITLLDKDGVDWPVRLRMEKGNRYMRLGSGSKQFLNAVGVKANESFVLELVWEDRTTPPMLKFCSKLPPRKFVRSSVMKKGSNQRDFTSLSSKRKRDIGESSQRASASSSSLSKNRFVTLTVSPTDLKCCRLYVKVRFTRPNGMEKLGGKKIIMLDNHGVEWPVNLLLEKVSKRMHLGYGFKEFLKAVGVKACESFVLELVWEDKKSLPMLKFCSKVKNEP